MTGKASPTGAGAVATVALVPDKASAVAIFDDEGRILLVKEGYGMRRWGLPGGAQEPNEDSRQAAAREAMEETGLEVRVGDRVGEYRISYADGSEQLCVSVFYAEILGGVLRPGAGEITETAWVHPDALPEPLTNVAPAAIPDAARGLRDVTRAVLAAARSH